MVDFYTVPLFSSTFSLCSVEFEDREMVVDSWAAVPCSRLLVTCPASPCRSEALTSFAQIVLFLLLSARNLR